MIEWEPVRKCGCRAASPLVAAGDKVLEPFETLDIDGRWARGLDGVCISLSEGLVSKAFSRKQTPGRQRAVPLLPFGSS